MVGTVVALVAVDVAGMFVLTILVVHTLCGVAVLRSFRTLRAASGGSTQTLLCSSFLGNTLEIPYPKTITNPKRNYIGALRYARDLLAAWASRTCSNRLDAAAIFVLTALFVRGRCAVAVLAKLPKVKSCFRYGNIVYRDNRE